MVHAFSIDDGGLLHPTDLPILDGEILTRAGYPLADTGRTMQLTNWGQSDGARPIYADDFGHEYVVVK